MNPEFINTTVVPVHHFNKREAGAEEQEQEVPEQHHQATVHVVRTLTNLVN